MNEKIIREKEQKAESKFMEWLKSNNVPFWYINQEKDTFSRTLKEKYGIKRPDFIILIPNVGFILTDVKHRNISEYYTIPVDKKEVEKYNNLQRDFNVQVWFVFSNEKEFFNNWYWIPSSMVSERGEVKIAKKTNEPFYQVSIKDFITVNSRDSIGRLFTEIFYFF